MKHAAGVNINFIPYQGSTPAVNALLGEPRHVGDGELSQCLPS